MEGLVETAAWSTNGFACGVAPSQEGERRDKLGKYSMSTYAQFDKLRDFQIHEYESTIKYESDGVPFESGYPTLGSFYDHLGIHNNNAVAVPEIVPLCFGGVFAASLKNIRARNPLLWTTIESSLSRGDNIQEGHYMERLWGTLLSSPLESYQVDAVRKYSNYVFESKHRRYPCFAGLMARNVRLAERQSQNKYIHK